MTISAKLAGMRRYGRCIATSGLLLGATALATQAEIMLRAVDDTFSVQGTLLSFEDNVYRIDSSLGVFDIPVALVTCEGEDCPEVDPMGQEILVAGSGEIFDALFPAALSSFAVSLEAVAQPGLTEGEAKAIDLTTGGGDLMARFTLASASASASDAHMSLLPRGTGSDAAGEQEIIVAQDALAIVVSPDLPLSKLTTAELDAIFSAQVVNWNELGGPDLPIKAFRPEATSGHGETFSRVVLEPNFSEFSDVVAQLRGLDEVASAVSQTSGGIGLTSSSKMGSAKPVGIVSSCGIVSYPESFAIKAEDYLLSRRLYLQAKDGSPSRARGLIEHLSTSAAAPAIETTGLTSLAASSISLDSQGSRLAHALGSDSQQVELPNLIDFAKETARAERLSTTFRFGSGSALLDDKGVGDIDRLLDVLKTPELQNREVMLIGFADSIGQSELNRVLSERRAQQVRDQIVEKSGGAVGADRFRVLGFGAAAPVACNDTEFERSLNRRVEVWLK